MITIEPQSDYPITFNITNPTETATLYVRAYIYDGTTDDTLLDTVDLTDLGNQRFKAIWRTPADVSGTGRYITIFKKIFTDSGYATESENYERKEEQLLIKQGWSFALQGIGGGGEVDYKKIQKMIKEELAKIPKPLKPKEVDFGPIIEAITNVPPVEKPNLNPVLDEIHRLFMLIKALPKPKEPEKLDLNPILSQLEAIKTFLGEKIDKKPVTEIDYSTIEAIKKELDNLIDTIKATQTIVLSNSIKGEDFVKMIDKNKTEIPKSRLLAERILKR